MLLLLNSCITPLDKKSSYRSEKPLLPVLPALTTGDELSSCDLEEEELTSTSARKEKQIEDVAQTQALAATLKPKAQVKKTRTVCTRKRTTRMPPCQVKGCPNIAVSRGSCVRHGGGSRCTITGCPNRAKLYKKCFQHGGFRTLSTQGCLCWAHGGGNRCKLDDCSRRSYQKYGYYCVDHTSYGEKTKRCRKASDSFGSSWVASGTNLY
ncbi:unnamed protein product [Peronospora effusa]|uniref:Uncharacterized protein n=1 Tax=Peronospora effusa TaxID=542832 RepID=A0A3M6VT71_9STRA|nr:hypothetical protein DD238_001881 [Peronospora effusa]CAI5706055.1 unnamed protein product [Peronospora effusa]